MMRAMERVSETLTGVAFGRFQVLPHRRELLADGQPIKLGGRAFDVLMALLEARGGVVGKGTLNALENPGDQMPTSVPETSVRSNSC